MSSTEKPISRMKKAMMNSDLYLFTFNEAALLLRINRKEFERLYIQSGLIGFVKDIKGRKLIRNSEIKEYQNKNEFIIEVQNG